jgi:branched-chain amino acid transport system substrate-binding protein
MSLRKVMTVAVALFVTAGVLGTGGVANAQPEHVVKIGVLAPLNAGLVEFGTGIRNSVQVAVDQANTKHAIPGWKIDLVAVNDSSDPPTAAGAATLVADPAVIGVVGPYNSGVAEQALPVFAPAHLALVSPSNTLASLTLGADPAHPKRTYDNYFRMVASDAQQAPFLARSAKKLGLKKIAVVSETKAVSKGLADGFAKAFTDGGGKVTLRRVVPDGASNFKDFLDAALPGNADAIFFGGEYQVASTLRVQATARGFKHALMGGDGIKDDAYITGSGPSAAGTLASTVGVPAARLASAKGFLKAYKKAGFAEPATDYGPYAYDAANLIIAAAAKLLKGQTSIPANARGQIVAALQKAHGKGASGPLGFDKFGDTKNRVFTLYRVQGAPPAWVPFKP